MPFVTYSKAKYRKKKRNDALDLQTYNLQNYKTKIKMDKVEFNKQAKLSDHLASP